MSLMTHTGSKLKSRSGETLAETLIAVLISALALVLLLTMITGSSRLIQNGEDKMKEMYEKPMAEKIVFSYKEQVVAASGGCTATINVTLEQSCNNVFDKNFNTPS